MDHGAVPPDPSDPRRGAPVVGGSAPGGSNAGAIDLGGTDCSGGLARCVGGQVELSLAAHLPARCAPGERAAGCACPWQLGPRCATGCVRDGLEIAAEGPGAAEQLCNANDPVVRAPLATELTDVTVCADESVVCAGGLVRACAARGQPSRIVAACVHGCAAGVELEPGDLLTGDGPAAILCRRAHAERR